MPTNMMIIQILKITIMISFVMGSTGVITYELLDILKSYKTTMCSNQVTEDK